MAKRQILICDLKNDPALIERYKEYHAAGNAWPEITESITSAGITGMEIFLAGNRLVMIMTTTDDFDSAAKAAADAANPKVREWETLMDTFQQRLPFAPNGEKWVRAEQIFDLTGANAGAV
ncbi:L-rhamnose mutarotase [Neolewinella aurantiaca]|uniref:L-rhamnose mutarotase n=1 Tax=Neolewinella aurantiaca TaxID=2602767 RepID=A0A5C7FKR9_9BACT|nr:L-rhamnose mutarotase [Neolewinella aurantiaca]TXF87933.1 L-rhamnose mutarotase [Neolewinella aurantiaca]